MFSVSNNSAYTIYIAHIDAWRWRQFLIDKHPFKFVHHQNSKCAAQPVAHRKPADLFEASNFLLNKDVIIQQCVQQHPSVASVQAEAMWFVFDDVFQHCLDCFFCVDIRVQWNNIKRDGDQTFQMIGSGVFEAFHKLDSAV